jgi:hypothetical protein
MRKEEINVYYIIKHRKVVAWGDMFATMTFDNVRQMKFYLSDEPNKKYIFIRLLKSDVEDQE